MSNINLWRRYTPIIIVATVIALASTQATAQPRVISLSQAIQTATSQNLDLMRSANQVELNQVTVDRQRAVFLPNLNASASSAVRFGQAFDQTTASLNNNQTTSLSLGLSSSINLFNGFADAASLEKARHEYEAAQRTYLNTSQSTVYTTTFQFLQILLNQELVKVLQQNLDAQNSQLERIDAFYKAGNQPYSDVLQQRATIAQTQQRLLLARHNVEVGALRLKQTLRLDPSVTIALEELPTVTSGSLTASAITTPETLVQQALASRPDVQAEQLRISAAEASIHVAKSGRYPSVSLNMSAGTNYSSQSKTYSFTDQLGNVNPSGSVGLSMTLPIFDRTQTSSNIAQTEIALRNEQLTLELLRQTVEIGVRQALLDVQTAELQLQTADVQITSAREALEAMQARYDVGASTLVDVIQARNLFVDAAAQRVQALYNIASSRLALAFQIGDVNAFVSSIQ